MRTQREIAERIKEVKNHDFLGFQREALLEFVTKETAETLRGSVLKKDASLDDWTNKDLNDESVLDCIKDYLIFAFGKALDHRGISADRSLIKLREWLWLIDKEKEVDWSRFAYYGCPALRQVAKIVGVEEPDCDTFRRMADGKRCSVECKECG